MSRRRFVAAWVLMAVLAVAPGLALAEVCAPHCCPAVAHATDAGAGESDDCRAGFASRSCCPESSAPLASFASVTSDVPIHVQAILPESIAAASECLRVPPRSARAELALRTSPLRLSVVLLI